MTLIFTESFEFTSGGSDKWTVSNSWSYSATAGDARTGSRGGSGSASSKVVAGNEHATFTIGTAHKPGSVGTATNIMQFLSDSGATTHVTIATNTNGSISAYRGTTSLLGTSAAGVLLFNNTFQYIEAQAILSDTVGSVIVRVGETIVLTLTGVDTKNAGTKTTFDSFFCQSITAGGGTSVDDIYVTNGAGSANTGFLGAVRIEALLPTGNGATSGMTNSAGNSTNNSTYVDDAFPTPDTSDYVDGVSTGDKDTYVMADSAQPSANSVKGVVVYNWAETTDAGARGLTTVTRLSGTEVDVAAQALTNGVFHLVWGVHETKPGGGGWTVADYNSAEVGQKAT